MSKEGGGSEDRRRGRGERWRRKTTMTMTTFYGAAQEKNSKNK
jgi:hypothetical protein